MLPERLANLIDFDPLTGRVTSREGKTREFKEAFKKADLADYGKTLAAYANTEGGTIIFGVSDSPREVRSFPAADLYDEANIVSYLRDSFHPEIPFEMQQYEHNTGIVAAITVGRCTNPPVICRKGRSKRVADKNGVYFDKQVTAEGAIYFRYSAQTRTIDYSELVALLNERERRRMQTILETLRAVERVGYENAGVVDVKALGEPDGLTTLYISKEAAKSMNFIDKGRFVESVEEGAPAYFVAGQVRLNQVVHAPLEDADRNLPSDVAEKLKPLVQNIYGAGVPITGGQVTKLIKHFGLEAMPFHEFDQKIRRRYITQIGIEKLEEGLQHDPLGALRSFSSRKNVEAYEMANFQ